MSNMTLFRDSNAVIPDYLKHGTDDFTKKLMSGGGGGRRISIRGSVFRMVVDGKEVAKNEDRAMEVVVVNVAEHNSRTYFAGTYVEGQNQGPDCWSNDGKTPDARAPNPQSSRCEGCPMNIAGAGAQKGRPCRFSRRIAVVLSNDIANSEVYQLTLPAQSIFGEGNEQKMPFQQYVNFLGGWGLSLRAVVTEMKFDTNSATPKLVFRAVKPLSQEEYEAAAAKGDTPAALQAISYTPAPPGVASVKTAPANVALEAPPAPARKADLEPLAEPPEPAVREKKGTAAPKDLGTIIDDWGSDDD